METTWLGDGTWMKRGGMCERGGMCRKDDRKGVCTCNTIPHCIPSITTPPLCTLHIHTSSGIHSIYTHPCIHFTYLPPFPHHVYIPTPIHPHTQVDGLYTTTALTWKPDATALMVGSCSGEVGLYDLSLRTQRLAGGRVVVRHVSASRALVQARGNGMCVGG